MVESLADSQKPRSARWLVILILAGVAVAASIWYFRRDGSAAPEYQATKVTPPQGGWCTLGGTFYRNS